MPSCPPWACPIHRSVFDSSFDSCQENSPYMFTFSYFHSLHKRSHSSRASLPLTVPQSVFWGPAVRMCCSWSLTSGLWVGVLWAPLWSKRTHCEGRCGHCSTPGLGGPAGLPIGGPGSHSVWQVLPTPQPLPPEAHGCAVPGRKLVSLRGCSKTACARHGLGLCR